MIVFKNRFEAGRLLAESLAEDWVHVDLVFAIPRGGIEAGASIARRFDCPLRPVLVAKVRHPDRPEYAIGAVDESGKVSLQTEAAQGIEPRQLELAIEGAQRTLAERKRFYSRLVPGGPVEGKVIVLVDDGLATGQTCRAALTWIRGLGPGKLLLAVPCASASGLEAVRRHCDGVVTLAPADPFFTSVGAYYEDFEQVAAAETKLALEATNRKFLDAEDARAARKKSA